MSQDLHSDNGVSLSVSSEPLDELSKFTFEDTKVDYNNFFSVEISAIVGYILKEVFRLQYLKGKRLGNIDRKQQIFY